MKLTHLETTITHTLSCHPHEGGISVFGVTKEKPCLFIISLNIKTRIDAFTKFNNKAASVETGCLITNRNI